jgi:hypothetical protein
MGCGEKPLPGVARVVMQEKEKKGRAKKRENDRQKKEKVE